MLRTKTTIRRTCRRTILPLVATALVATVPASAEEILIRGATVRPVTAEPIEDGSVLVSDGRIAAVGRDLEAPPGARVLEGSGMYLTPGIIDAHSHIAAETINEGAPAVSSMVDITHVLDPTDVNIYRELAGGVTTSHILHGSANPIGGQSRVIKHRWGVERAEDLIFEAAPPTIKFALGENPKRSNFEPPPGMDRRYPATRMGVLNVIREAFTEAQQYRAEWQEYERRNARGEDVVPPRRDLTLEPLVEVLEGERLVHAHSYRADEILHLMRLAEEMGFKIAVFQHVLEGYQVADELAAHGAGASTFSDWWAYKMEAYDAIPYNAALMTRRGVVVSINSDSAEEARHLNQEAAKTMKWGGLSEAEALALVTINPAIQLGVEDRVGSIEEGKDADLVLWSEHPLSTYAVAQTVLVDGEVLFDRQEDLARRDEIRKEKERLQALLDQEEEAGGEEPDDEDEPEEPEEAPESRGEVQP